MTWMTARRRMLIAILIGGTIITGAPARADIYTWKDEEGRTHFSQTPPGLDSSQDSANTIPSPHVITPRHAGSRVFCGNNPVDIPESLNHENYLLLLARRLSDDQRHTDNRTAQGRCRQAWTYQQLQHYRGDVEALKAQYRTALEEHQSVITARANNCPTQAEGWMVGQAAERWASCHLPSTRQERLLKQTLERLRPIQNVHFPE